MPPAVNGPSGATPSHTLLECAPNTSAFDHAIDVVGQELTLMQGSVDRVEAACAEVRRERHAWSLPGSVQRLRGLTRLATRGSSAARRPLVQLLYEVAEASDDPWGIFAELLESHDQSMCDETLDRLRQLAQAGRFRVDGRVVDGLGRLVESGPDLLRERTALEMLRHLLRGPPGETLADDAVLTALYLESAVALSRRLAARLLDLSSSLPSPTVAVRILGQELADYLEPYLAYTRATHLDLLDLAGGGLSAEALLASLREAETFCGSPLLREIVSALGWRSINCGLAVRTCAAITVGGSFPLLVEPGEAALLERCADVRRVFERLVIVAHAVTPWGGEAAPSGSDAIDRFRKYNIRHADLLIDLLDVAPLGVEKVRRMLHAMDSVVEDFQILFSGGHADECAAIATTYRALENDIERELTSSSPDRPLSATLTRLVQMFEDPASPSDIHTLHGCKRYLHQRGLQLGSGLAESTRATNRAITLVLASSEEVQHVLRAIEYADFEARDEQPAIPHVVRAAVDAFARHLIHGERSFPKLKIFCYGNEVHCFAAFRNHPAFIRVDFSPPQRGGMIDLEYCGVSKYDLEWHPNVSLDAIQQIFRAVDFDVQVVNTRIHARYDKERAADLKDLGDKLQSLFFLVPYLMDVDWVIADLDLSDEAKGEVAAAWAEFFVRWGIVPMRHVLTADRRGILTGIERTPAGDRELRWSGSGPYRDCLTVDPPAGFWASLRAEVDEQGLGHAVAFDGERPVAQLTLETHLLGPLRKAVARGQVLQTGERLAASPPHLYAARHEAALLAEILSSDDETILRSARLARLAERLEGGLRLDPTGTVNGYEVQRAVLPLAGETVGLYVLCDGGGIPRLALFGRGDTLYERRERADGVSKPNWSADVEALSADLRRANFTAGWIEPDLEESGIAARKLRTVFGTPNAWARSAPVAGDRCLGGVKASPGRAVGLARPGLSGRRPVDLEGGILIAPALGPRDNPFVFRSAGIVSTGGGVLSHAGLLALQFRKPALVVSGRWERSSSGAESLVYSCMGHREVRRRVGGYDVTERHDATERDERVQDGDVVVLDADEGTLHVIGQELDALALYEGLRQLAAASRSLAAAASDTEVLAHRGRMLRARHQLERLLARIEDPALARYAAAELLAGEAGAEPALGQGEKVRLLRAVFANASVGAAAAGTVEELAYAIGRRAASLGEQAAQLVPTSDDPLEVLTLRLDAIGSRELRDNVSDLLGECGVPVPRPRGSDVTDVDTLALHRLRALRARTLAVIAEPIEPDGPARQSRHILRQLHRLDDVLGISASGREASSRAWARLAFEDAAVVGALSTRRVLGPADGGVELWPLVGSKAANLAEAERLGEGALIPRWFVVADRAFREMLDLPIADETVSSGSSSPVRLRELIERTLARPDLSDAQKSLAIGHAWETARLPEALVTEVAAAYRTLALEPREPSDTAVAMDDPEKPFVAVRSSAREEDLEAATRAGEFDTFLFVRGVDGLCECLRRAWSGLWTERAIHNRTVLGISGEVGGGVLVQRMVWARASGVLHTINLAEGRLREMVINAGLGLGEGIVSGAVAADQVIVSKQESLCASQLRFRYITNDKRERVVFDAGFGSGTTRVSTLYHQRLRPALEYVELCEIAGVASRLESAYRQPLDIEFAIEGTALWLLQVRPVPAALAAWRETIDRHPLIRRST